MQLFYKHYGSGTPLLILHGLLGASGNWHTLSSRVFGEHFSTFTIDQRNHGRSPHHDTHDYDALADDLRAFMDEHGLARAHVLGHSMGGKTAMQFALRYPERVDRLVVVDIAPRAYPDRHSDILAALRAVDPAGHPDRKSIDRALADRVPLLGVRQFLLKNLEHEDGRYRWKMNLDALEANYAVISGGVTAEGTFDGPTLFVRGGRSDYLSDADVPAIRARFPAARLVTIEGAGHWVHAEAPKAFGEAVVAFLTADDA